MKEIWSYSMSNGLQTGKEFIVSIGTDWFQ